MAETTFIPSFQLGCPIITDPQTKIAYIVRHYVYDPGNTSSSFNHEIVSLRMHAAAYGHKKEIMTRAVQDDLYNVISRHYPNDNIVVECSTRDLPDGARYAIIVDIQIDTRNGLIPILYNGLIERSENGEFVINIDSSLNKGME